MPDQDFTMIDQFSIRQFELVLDNIMPLGWLPLGLDLNEYCYIIEVNSNARIHIRSSIGKNGIADETGKDSIRLNLEIWQSDFRRSGDYKWIALPKKAIEKKRWITRVSGWQERLEEGIRLRWDIAKEFRQPVEFCSCGKAPFVGISKNEGRPYSSCLQKHGGCGQFLWLDKSLEGKVGFNENNTENDNVSNEPVAYLGGPKALDVVQSDETDSKGMGDRHNCRSGNGSERDETDMHSMSQESQEKEPNPKQLEAIQASIDANIRVLAPPGSGKTFVIEQRYKYLVENGINPDNILAVTFSNKMAASMASRILNTCPQANTEQISTIHAFCYRLLTKWDKGGDYYGWRVAGGTGSPVKSWEIKKWLDDFIADEWEEKPGYQEVLKWIDTSKYHGFRYDDPECLEWFIDTLGSLYGQRLHRVRKRFDTALYQRKCMTFADMLLLTELKLKKDFAFRIWCQDRFSHVIIDEAHDTNYQAMRILITISLEPGENNVYESDK